MSQLDALSTSTRAPHAARRPSGIRRSSRSSARSAARSRRSPSTRPAPSSSSISSRRCASCRTTRAAGSKSGASVQCQSCKAVSVFDPAASARTATSAARRARAVRRDQGADPPAEPAAVQGHRTARSASRSGAGTRASGWRPNSLRKPRARRSRARRLHPVLDVRRARRLPVEGRSGPLLLHDRNVPRQARATTQTRQVRHVRWEPASGEVHHFFDDEPVPGTHGVSHDAAEAGRAVSDGRARPVRHRLICPASSSSTTRSCWSRRRESLAGADDAEAARHVRRARCPATPTATWRFTRRSRARRSSTSWCRCGC